MSCRLTLPYPVSANRYWRTSVPRGHSRPIVYVSDEGRAYKLECAWRAREAGIRKPMEGPLFVSYELYPKRPQDWAKRAKADPLWWDLTVQSIDLDNARKVANDGLNGIAWFDDKQIRKDPGEIMIPDGDGRLVLTIQPYRRARADVPRET